VSGSGLGAPHELRTAGKIAMSTIAYRKGRVLLLAAATLVLAAAIVAMPRIAGAVALEEGETQSIPPGGIVPSNAHFVALATSIASTLKEADGCATENGASTTVYDGTCTVNGVLENPCVITGATTVVIATVTNAGCFASAGLTSAAGELISIATSGPLAGCGTGGEYLPWSNEAGAFVIGLVPTFSSPFPSISSAACPTNNAGGIGVVTSFPP